MIPLVAAIYAVGMWATVAEALVPVTVYYESLCPDSIKFYNNQLYPAMQVFNLSKNVDLSLVPYGKSSQVKNSNNTWSFTCHHGERECYGNKVHACALKHIASKNERLEYINCLMKTMLNNRDAVFPTEKCADNISEKNVIISCANGTSGDDELAGMGNKTMAFQAKLTSVPTIVFNSVYDAKDQEQAQTNFKGVLCKYIPAPKPAECDGTSSASSFVTGPVSLVAAFITIILANTLM